MNIVHLAASPFVGGPERQMLGLAKSLPAEYRTSFVVFDNHGKSAALVKEARREGFATEVLQHDAPRYRAATREVAGHLRRLDADVVCCHGYKPDILGWRAARQAGVPLVSVSHGWTAATFKVRLNEALDRLVLRYMDRVVCVSAAQAVKVRRAGVADQRIALIHNAVGAEAFAPPDPAYRELLRALVPGGFQRIVGAAGRLSPEKGFGQLVEAAERVVRADAGAAFVLFGDGPLRGALAEQISVRGLDGRFVLAGFRTDLGRFLPHLDVLAIPSFTEGLPVIALEALAAGVPVVATAVGGTPEVIEDQVNGYLVPAGQPDKLAQRVVDALHEDAARRAMGQRGRMRVEEDFTFETQSARYQVLFEEIAARHASGVC